MSTPKEETRLRLLDAARKLLVKRGFHGVGLDDIAEAAGVSRQAVYKSHFASKAELVLELVRHVHVAENLDELTRPVFEARTGLEMLERTIVAIVKIEARVHDLGVVLSAAALSDAGAAEAWRDRMDVKHGALRAALTRTHTEGHLSPGWTVDEGVALLAALLSVDSYQLLVVENAWQPEALSQRIWELCQKSLLVATPRKPLTPAHKKGRGAR